MTSRYVIKGRLFRTTLHFRTKSKKLFYTVHSLSEKVQIVRQPQPPEVGKYRKWERDDGSSCSWKIIIPKSRILDVLREDHDSGSGGHFGEIKTLRITRE
ncbi:hypothetical protein AVEN_215805-1 [Araneus ventricosus]|uniref:Uncharacterized protein n=1 Tax=Araneus ventricosus TaxID=182803 RepID=A0A4Y2KX53_ARAVE|nr:hypothetical protein AVEN_215805-1 [Araneus ventricosus]